MEQPNEYSFMNAPSATDRFNMIEKRKMQKAAKLTLQTMEKAGVSFHHVSIERPPDEDGWHYDSVLVARVEGNDIAVFPYYDDEWIRGE